MYTIKHRAASIECQQYLDEARKLIDLELSNVVSSISKLRLLPQIRYTLLSHGKRLRPILLVLSAQCVGGDKDKVMPLALTIELVHTSTLIHDDIIDKEKLRRGTPTLYRKWSLKDAILVGDALIALAIYLAADFGPEIMRVISQTALDLCEGEHMDINSSLLTTTREDYFLKIRKKSAHLFRDAAYCGALLGGGSSLEIGSLSSYGENYGIAYQIRDDLLDLTDSEKAPIEITLPIIHAYEMSDPTRRKRLEEGLGLFVGSNQTSSRIASTKIQKILNDTGSIDYCRKEIIEYIERSIASVSPLKDTGFKSHLIHVARSLIP